MIFILLSYLVWWTLRDGVVFLEVILWGSTTRVQFFFRWMHLQYHFIITLVTFWSYCWALCDCAPFQSLSQWSLRSHYDKVSLRMLLMWLLWLLLKHWVVYLNGETSLTTVLHEFEWHCLGVMCRIKGALMLKTSRNRRKMSPQLSWEVNPHPM